MTIMIATIYSYEPIIKSVISLGAKHLILIIDEKSNKEQEAAIKRINELLNNYVKIEVYKTQNYNLYNITSKIIELIDRLNANKLILNISCGRKTKALGLMYAGYCRKESISKIIYVTKEEDEILELPILDIIINKSEREVLEIINKHKHFNINLIRGAMNISKSQIYKLLDKLKKKSLVDDSNKITLSGRIYLLKND